MACTKNALESAYDVFEYDSKGVAHPSGKKVILESGPTTDFYVRVERIILSFFKQMFGTITSSSGFSATYDGAAKADDLITISWRKPHWKLVKCK